MKKDFFLKRKYRTLISRLAVGAVAVALGGVLILWDVGIIDLPFLVRKNRREPEKTTETLEETGDETETEVITSVDWDAFAQDAVDSLYDFSSVANGESLVTLLPYDAETMTLTKQKLSGGSFSASMGFVTKDDTTPPLLFTSPGMQEIEGAEDLQLTHHRDALGNAVFQSKTTNEYFRFDPETMTFVPTSFDPLRDDRGVSFPLPLYYGQSDEEKSLVYENGLYGYTGQYLDGRRKKTFTVPPTYPTAFAYSEGFAVMADAEGRVTIRNERGEEVFTELSLILPDKKEEESLGFSYFDGGILRVVIAGYDAQGNLTSRRESIINTKGQEVSLPTGYSAVSLSEGILLVTDGEKYGYLSSTGAWIADPIYSAASPFMEGLAAVKSEDGKMGLIDTKGNAALACAFDLVTSVSDGSALCYSQGTGWYLLTKLTGSFAPVDQPEQPKTTEYYTKMTITRGPQNTFDYDPDEIIELPPILSTSPRTTHPENTVSQQIK